MSLQDQSGSVTGVVSESIPPQEPSESIRCPSSAGETFVLRAVQSLSAVELAALERLAFEHGQSPDAYLAIEMDRHCFLTPDLSAAMSVVVSGRYLHIPGGILAPQAARLDLVILLRT